MRNIKASYVLVSVVGIAILFISTFLTVKLFTKGDNSILNENSIAIVEIKEMIIDSEEIIKQLHYSRDQDDIKAIVLRIDTPGGVVGPTQEIYEEIKKLKKNKPIVVSMGSVAASGGYYIATPANCIYANPGTITGSIGVLMKLANVQSLLNKIGVDSLVLKSGEYKDTGSPVRAITSGDKKILQGIIDSMYEQFVRAVAEGRKLPVQKVKEIADGRIFTGEQALKLHLVDKLGNLHDAIDEATKIAKIKGKPNIIYPPRTKKSFMNIFMEGFSGSLIQSLKHEYSTSSRFEY
jgi:protease-4